MTSRFHGREEFTILARPTTPTDVSPAEHYIREAVELEEIKLYYVPTNLQFADIFTKNLGKQKFQEGRNALRLLRL